MEKKATSVKISEGEGEVKYIESAEKVTGAARKDHTADEFIRNQEFSQNSWTKRRSYLLCCILIGNGTDIFPAMMRFSHAFSGGSMLLLVLFFSILFGLPLMYMECFLGRYTRLTNCQMYRMAPIFFGCCLVVFLVNIVYQCLHATEDAQILVSFLKVIVDPDINMKCVDDSRECYDYKVKGPINDTCHYFFYAMMCLRYGIVRYPTQHYYWKMFKDSQSAIFPLYQVIIAVVVTWTFILVIIMRKVSAIGRIIIITFGIHISTVTGIFIASLFYPGSVAGLMELFNVQLNKINKSQVLVINWFSLCRLGLIIPTGFMTSSAYAEFKSRIGTECVMTVIFSILLSFYYHVVYFAMAGVLAEALNVPVKHVIVPDRGIYLTLVPELLVYLQIPNILLLLYYGSLWFLEISKIALYVHMLILNIYDYFPRLRAFATYVWSVSCVFLCAICITMCSKSAFTSVLHILWSQYITKLIGITLTLESTMVSYLYGVVRLSDDIYFDSGEKPIKFWITMWYLIPALGWITVIFFDYNRTMSILEVDCIIADAQSHPMYVNTSYAVRMLLCWVFPFFTIVYVIFRLGTPNFVCSLFKPQYFWGPPENKDRANRKKFKPRLMIRSQQISQKFVDYENATEVPHAELVSEVSKEVIRDRFISKSMEQDKFFESIGLYYKISVPPAKRNWRFKHPDYRDILL